MKSIFKMRGIGCNATCNIHSSHPEWIFLQRIMEKMGFHPRWVGWIMECIKSVTYSVLINGEPKVHIFPTRGIRQGDPLSPYLFLLCLEGLNGLIKQAVNEKHIEGFSLCKYGPKNLIYSLRMTASFFVEHGWKM